MQPVIQCPELRIKISMFRLQVAAGLAHEMSTGGPVNRLLLRVWPLILLLAGLTTNTGPTPTIRAPGLSECRMA